MEKKVVFAFLYILIFPALILLLSGDLFWPAGWIFCIWFILLCFWTILYLYKKDPALLEERYRQPGSGNQELWDRSVVYGLVIGFTLWIIIMPLDAKRFGWSPVFPLWLNILGGAGLAGSFFLFFRSYTDNTFLSPLVRIQEELSELEAKSKVLTEAWTEEKQKITDGNCNRGAFKKKNKRNLKDV